MCELLRVTKSTSDSRMTAVILREWHTYIYIYIYLMEYAYLYSHVVLRYPTDAKNLIIENLSLRFRRGGGECELFVLKKVWNTPSLTEGF